MQRAKVGGGGWWKSITVLCHISLERENKKKSYKGANEFVYER